MKKILYERKNGKIPDIIEYILNTNKKEFKEILNTFIDPHGTFDVLYQNELNNPDITMEIFNISTLLKELSKIAEKDELTKEQKKRIQKLQQYRNEKALKKLIKTEYKLSKQELSEIFEVLEGNESFSKLIDSKKMENQKNAKSKNIFSFLKSKKVKLLPETGDSIKNHYYQIMYRIGHGDYALQFFTEKQKDYTNSITQINDRIMAEKQIDNYQIVIGKDDEPQWEINNELKEYVYKDIPKELTPEETAIWIYMKLCQTLNYDDSRAFDKNISDEINIDLLQNTKPNSDVVCFDFSRIYAKFVNSIPGDAIKADIIGTTKHFFVNLISNNIIMTAEATSAISNTNEFFKIKMRLPIEGLYASYDPKGIVQSSINKFIPLIYNNDVHTTKSYIDMLNTIRADESEKDTKTDESKLYNKLRALSKTMKQYNVSGIEALEGVIKFAGLGFFGDNVEHAWIKRKVHSTGEEIKYKSGVIINQKENNQFYILDCTSMQVLLMSKEDLLEKFKNGNFSYKDPKYTIKALENDLTVFEKETDNQREENMEDDYYI